MLKQLLSVFLESHCPFCDRTTPETFCSYCRQKLSSHQLKEQERLNCWDDLSLFAWGKYDGQLKRAIALMKYNNKPEIGRVLGQLLAQVWLDSKIIKSQQTLTVIPIPLHDKKLQHRGFNQAEVIARSFCQSTGYRLNKKALTRVRDTKVMFDLSPEERIKNLQGAFHLGNNLPKSPVLLLDDIYTLGTTIKESTKVLRQQKIKVVGAVIVAKTGTRFKA